MKEKKGWEDGRGYKGKMQGGIAAAFSFAQDGELGLSRQPSSNGRVRASLSQSSPHQTTQQIHRQLSM